MIVIVGSGAAAASAAETLRDLGFAGEVRLFGSEPAVPYERPGLSKGFLTSPVLEPQPLIPSRTFAERDIRLEQGTRVDSINPRKKEVVTREGEHYRYEMLLLATGAEPRRLDIPGCDLGGIHYLRELQDAREIRKALRPDKHVTIVGGGVIGLEIAAAARRLGCAATVIEAAPQLMGRVVPEELAEVVGELHRQRRVTIRIGVRPVAFVGSERVTGVVLQNGDVVETDVVVVGIGVLPRTELAEQAGLAVDNGILLDEYFRSSDPHIFAAGDVARVFHVREQRRLRIEQWRPARDQGRHAAASMMGSAEPYRDVPWMWSDQHDFEIQMTGFGFEGAEIVRRGEIGARGGLAYFALRGDQLIGASGVSLGSSIGRTIRVAQIIIEQELTVTSDDLRDPELNLRSLARSRAATSEVPRSDRNEGRRRGRSRSSTAPCRWRRE